MAPASTRNMTLTFVEVSQDRDGFLLSPLPVSRAMKKVRPESSLRVQVGDELPQDGGTCKKEPCFTSHQKYQTLQSHLAHVLLHFSCLFKFSPLVRHSRLALVKAKNVVQDMPAFSTFCSPESPSEPDSSD